MRLDAAIAAATGTGCVPCIALADMPREVAQRAVSLGLATIERDRTGRVVLALTEEGVERFTKHFSQGN